ncbi:dihydroorotase [Roseivirga pacifica]|uniref:dihydroorotase n=1 Tax=Roseivirga pacifica TaxID=1267423 RepID=UPI0020952A5B|nr:dihydroorotase [Roseivirga pacifica]MCO6358202.1 dihydroorotase [Roseivirga pacifica]MCO6366334.1 dihydroorotase [Roseivirga pacifica]MCO6369115.1 dihydroorotase [Roseivirga pacifica]MCO6373933.1 dihydroorotase [Roseivirga pacifica]MCO6378309.1 dihydroorotase [Roseivirga pacifica]
MNLLIRGAHILNPDSPFHNSIKDIFIEAGVIRQIGDNLSVENAELIDAKGCYVSVGWFDLRANFQDPGLEHKEDLESGSQAAMAAGFTDVLLLPNAQPVVDSKNAVAYYQKWSKYSLVDLHPMAAVSLKAEGKELTEMIDLHSAGAKAFSDGVKPIWHTDIMLKSLQYLQKFDGLLINKPEDELLTAFGHMNEGEVSTVMGLKGMPSIAESLMIQRDLELLEYAGGKVHFSLISSKDSVALIREAKAKGLKVTCDVGVNYLKFIDADAQSYDTNFKVNPPYRTEQDRLALVEGVLDGTIDVIVSDHYPHDEECKKLEFDLADFGTNNLQGFLPVLIDVFGDDFEKVVDRFTSKPREILGVTLPKIEEGADACLTIFSKDRTWQFNKQTNLSKSLASPLMNQELKGAVLAVTNKGQVFKTNNEA